MAAGLVPLAGVVSQVLPVVLARLLVTCELPTVGMEFALVLRDLRALGLRRLLVPRLEGARQVLTVPRQLALIALNVAAVLANFARVLSALARVVAHVAVVIAGLAAVLSDLPRVLPHVLPFRLRV